RPEAVRIVRQIAPERDSGEPVPDPGDHVAASVHPNDSTAAPIARGFDEIGSCLYRSEEALDVLRVLCAVGVHDHGVRESLAQGGGKASAVRRAVAAVLGPSLDDQVRDRGLKGAQFAESPVHAPIVDGDNGRARRDILQECDQPVDARRRVRPLVVHRQHNAKAGYVQRTMGWSARSSRILTMGERWMISGLVPTVMISMGDISQARITEQRPDSVQVEGDLAGGVFALESRFQWLVAAQFRQHGPDDVVAAPLDGAEDLFLGHHHLVDLFTRSDTGDLDLEWPIPDKPLSDTHYEPRRDPWDLGIPRLASPCRSEDRVDRLVERDQEAGHLFERDRDRTAALDLAEKERDDRAA